MGQSNPKITLIGAGLNGPLLAIGLVQRGFTVEIYERRADMRRVRQSAGRSINLALSARGIHALEQAGLWKDMQRIIIPMKGRMMHALSGEMTFQPYGRDDSQVINSISRAELNMALMNFAEARGVKINFEQRCVKADLATGDITVRHERTREETTIESDVVIGCDGSASAIRGEMTKASGSHLEQQTLDYGYKELTIPPGSSQKHLLDTHGLHIWPRGRYMLIALPNIDGTFGCILFLPFDGPDSFATLASHDDVRSFFENRFPDAFALMPQVAENFFANPTGNMVTVRCSPWHARGKFLLLGDAAHAIVPFLGQGLNCGFEDCTCLLELIDRHGTRWPMIFSEFEKARKINTDAIADMAIENFVEMRDRVADPRFLLRKKVELALEARYPDLFVPRYSMVTFNRFPYAVAQARGAVQDKILSQLCDRIESVDDLDWNLADKLISGQIAPLAEAH